MADSSYGLPEIAIDLNVTGARTIRSANDQVKIYKIVISGVGPTANTGHIALRSESASGPLIYFLHVRNNASAEVYTIDAPFSNGDLLVQGLFMDTQTNAWAANSWMIIYTA